MALLLLLTCLLASPLPTSAQVLEPTPVPPELTPVAPAQPDSIQMQRQVQLGDSLQPGEEVQFTFLLQGHALAGCFGTPLKPVDAVVLLDTSPSAGVAAPGSNLERAQVILRSLWTQMDQPIFRSADDTQPVLSRLGIVTVDTGVTAPEISVRLPLTHSLSAIQMTIDSLQNGADSSFDVGLQRAADLLAETGRAEATPVLIILLHDSFFATQEAVVGLARQAAESAEVFVIGNTLNIRAEERLSGEVAESLTVPDHVFIDPSAEDLRRLFVLASGSNDSIASRGISVFDEITPTNLIDAPFGIGSNGRVNGSQVVWDISEVISEEHVTLQYRFRVRPDAEGLLSASSGALYLDCNGFVQTGGDLLGRPLDGVSFQIGTPVPTTSPSPSISPTPTDVAPDADVPLVPGDVDISVPEVNPPSPRLFFGFPWWVLGLLLLLLLLALAWLFWRWLRRPPAIPQSPRAQPSAPTLSTRRYVGPQAASNGEQIEPGRATNNEVLLEQLRSAQVFRGRIVTGQSGAARSRVQVRAFDSPKAMGAIGGLNPESLGSCFLWQRSSSETEVPTVVLRQVLEERVSATTPLLAVWTEQPTDNEDLQVEVRPNVAARQIDVQVHSIYRASTAGASGLRKSYWLELRFLNNPGFRIVTLPVIEG